MQIIPEMRCAH